MPGPQTLDRLLGTWSSRQRASRAAAAAFVHGATLLVVSIAFGLVLPDWSVWLDPSLAVLWIALVAVEIGRSRPDGRRLDRQFGLGDRLRTVLDARTRTRQSTLLPWLERDVTARVAAATPRRRTVRLGRLRYAAWLLLVAVALKLLSLPAPPGELPLASLGGSAPVPVPELVATAEAESPPQGGDGEAEPGQEQEPPPDAEPDDDPSEPDPEEADPGPAEDLLEDLPELKDFAAPQFVGDGASDTVSAPTAALDELPGSPEGATAPTASRGGGEQPDPPPADPKLDFERAREDALRARHVRDDERSFVRAWFDRLVESERKR